MNEAANDSAPVSGQDRKIPRALGTNQIAGFGGFRPLASLEKIKRVISEILFMVIYAPLSLVLSTLYARDHKNSNKVKAHSWESGNEVTRVTS